uniref:Uncharacterized protein n=1 Tax=Parascaris equorum TaxID=6256 RepID=A0A914R8H4_PAREQ
MISVNWIISPWIRLINASTIRNQRLVGYVTTASVMEVGSLITYNSGYNRLK